MSDTIEFTCSNCGLTIRAQTRHIGQKANCPGCNSSVTIQGDPSKVVSILADTSHGHPETTDINAALAGLAGAIATVVMYAVIFFPLRATYIGQLFTNRGPVPFIATFVTCWGLAILVLKYIAVKRQVSYAERELELMPLEAGMQITPGNSDRFLTHLSSLPSSLRESILGRRIRGALEHFRARTSVPEVQSYLSSRSEIDASGVESGYTLLRTFIWAVPILGFIGTVLGISSAVSGLADSLNTGNSPTAAMTSVEESGAGTPHESASSSSVEQQASGDDVGLGERMVGAMGLVTQGLATAFDTTFLALVMAIILMFPTEALRKTEYAMLDRIDSFTNECVLRRMSDSSGSKAVSPDLAKYLEPAFQEHQRWLLQWQQNVGQLGSEIGKAFEEHVSRVEQKVATLGGDRINDISTLATTLRDAIDSMEPCLTEWRQSTETIATSLRSSRESSQALRDDVQANTEAVLQLNSDMPKFQLESLGALAEAVRQLVRHLEEHDGQARPVDLISQPQDSLPRRWWVFGRNRDNP